MSMREMKDSGIEWIGEIPKDCSLVKFNKICNKITDFVASGSFESLRKNVPYLDEPNYTLLVRTTDLSGSARSENKVYIFADYLYRVLPKTPHEKVDLTNKVLLLNSKIEQGETEAIQLSGQKPEVKGEYPGKAHKPEDNRDLLDNIIDKVNLMFQGNFTEADRVMVEGIFDRIQKAATKKLKKQATSNDETQFVESIFPNVFNQAAQNCYTTQANSFKKLFEDPEFYQVLMQQMGHTIYERYKIQEEQAFTIENLQLKFIPGLREDFKDIKGYDRTLEEAFEWMIKVIKTPIIDKYNGLEETVLNPMFKLYCSTSSLTNAEKRNYLKALTTSFESYLKKIYYILNDEEVTDKNGSIEFAGLSSALYLMRLNKLQQYSEKPSDQHFAQYIEILTNLRNDESHAGKALTAKDIALGIHVVSALYLYVAYTRISDFEMREAELTNQEARKILDAEATSDEAQKRFGTEATNNDARKRFEELRTSEKATNPVKHAPTKTYSIIDMDDEEREKEALQDAAEVNVISSLDEEGKRVFFQNALTQLINHGGYTKKDAVFTKRRHWISIYRVASAMGLVIDGDFPYFEHLVATMNQDQLPVKLTSGFLEKAVAGVYAQHIDDWTNEGLEGRKLQEFEDIYHCAKVIRGIVEREVGKK